MKPFTQYITLGVPNAFGYHGYSYEKLDLPYELVITAQTWGLQIGIGYQWYIMEKYQINNKSILWAKKFLFNKTGRNISLNNDGYDDLTPEMVNLFSIYIQSHIANFGIKSIDLPDILPEEIKNSFIFQ